MKNNPYSEALEERLKTAETNRDRAIALLDAEQARLYHASVERVKRMIAREKKKMEKNDK